MLAAFVEPGAGQPVYHLTLVAVGLIAVLGTAGTVRTGINARRVLRARDAATPADPLILDPAAGPGTGGIP